MKAKVKTTFSVHICPNLRGKPKILQAVIVFFTYMWCWLSCRTVILSGFLLFTLYTLSSSVTPFFHSPFLQRRCPVSKFSVLSHVLLVPPLVQLVQFQLHCRPPTTQSIFFLPESSLWFISQMSNLKSIWTVKRSLDFEVIQSYKNWNFLKLGTVWCGVWVKGVL